MSKETYSFHELAQIPKDLPLYGVMGSPIGHSLSPSLQMAGFEACKLPARFVRLEVKSDELKGAVEQMKQMGFKGWNVTLPHKIAIQKYLDELDPSARELGAVNTVVSRDGKLMGFNTDGPGWERAIREEFSIDLRDLRIMILGTGATGQTLARQAALEGCERLVLVNRTFEKARALAEELEPVLQSHKLLRSRAAVSAFPLESKLLQEEIGGIDLIVNCTSVGLLPMDPSILPARLLQPHLLVYDTIYRPAKTAFLENASAAGARTANGLSMLLHQGALAFEIWTGLQAPLQRMRDALRSAA